MGNGMERLFQKRRVAVLMLGKRWSALDFCSF